MARYFVDSSALVKRYHPEMGSATMESLLASPRNRFMISKLAWVEVQSSFARRVRERLISEFDFAELRQRLSDDVADDC